MVGATGIEPVTPTMSGLCAPVKRRAISRNILGARRILSHPSARFFAKPCSIEQGGTTFRTPAITAAYGCAPASPLPARSTSGSPHWVPACPLPIGIPSGAYFCPAARKPLQSASGPTEGLAQFLDGHASVRCTRCEVRGGKLIALGTGIHANISYP